MCPFSAPHMKDQTNRTFHWLFQTIPQSRHLCQSSCQKPMEHLVHLGFTSEKSPTPGKPQELSIGPAALPVSSSNFSVITVAIAPWVRVLTEKTMGAVPVKSPNLGDASRLAGNTNCNSPVRFMAIRSYKWCTWGNPHPLLARKNPLRIHTVLAKSPPTCNVPAWQVRFDLKNNILCISII